MAEQNGEYSSAVCALFKHRPRSIIFMAECHKKNTPVWTDQHIEQLEFQQLHAVNTSFDIRLYYSDSSFPMARRRGYSAMLKIRNELNSSAISD